MKDPQPRLNRTFVELKHKEEVKDALKQTGLNRTFVELKLVRHDFPREALAVLIEPLWN